MKKFMIYFNRTVCLYIELMYVSIYIHKRIDNLLYLLHII